MAGQNAIVGPVASVVICSLANAATVAAANGAAAVIAAGGILLGCREGQGTFDQDTPEGTDTNDYPDKSYGSGLHAMRWTIRTYRQTTGTLANGPPHAAGGLNITPFTQRALFVYPRGVAAGAAGAIIAGVPIAVNAYIFPIFIFNQFRPAFRVEGSQFQEFDLDGTSNGPKGLPSSV